MALGAIVGAALTTPTAKQRLLTISGVDVLKEPGSQRYGVDPETVIVREAHAGGVSELSFDLDDPNKIIVPTDGLDVVFWDLQYNFPIFVGWTDVMPGEPAFGQQGRVWHVTCTGIEALLDWYLLPGNLTIPAGSVFGTGVQSIVQATGLPVKGFWDVLTGLSTTDHGIYQVDSMPLPAGVALTAGTTAREAIRQLSAGWPAPGPGGSQIPNYVSTVDFWGNLRVWWPPQGWDDRSGVLRANETGTGTGTPVVGANMQHGVNSAAVRSVVVQGSGVTATVGDGTGKRGPAAFLTSSVTTVAAAQLAAAAYLSSNTATVSGSFDLLDTAQPKTTGIGIGIGTIVLPENAALGISGVTYVLQSLGKRFRNDGREDWHIDYGGPAPTMTSLVRRLTRSTISA